MSKNTRRTRGRRLRRRWEELLIQTQKASGTAMGWAGSAMSPDSIAARVVRDLQEADLGRNVWRDLEDSYGFFLDDEEREQLAEMGDLERHLVTVIWVLKRLVMSLAPSRRWIVLSSFAGFVYGLATLRWEMLAIAFLALLFLFMFELRDKLLARDELEVGRAVQLALLPSANPELAGWDIWLYSRPANDVGGDLLDYIERRDGRLGLALGDVAGKGLGAALLMSKLQSTLRAYAYDTESLVDLGSRTNRVFCRDGLSNRFATMVFVTLGSNESRVRVLNAGHPPPLLLSGGAVTTLPPVALPLGVMPDAKFQEQALETKPGDVVLIYSDGLSEATNADDEMLGDDQVVEHLRQIGSLSATDVGERMLEVVRDFVGEARVHDDLSIAVLRRR